MRGELRLWNGQTQPSQEMILMNSDSALNKCELEAGSSRRILSSISFHSYYIPLYSRTDSQAIHTNTVIPAGIELSVRRCMHERGAILPVSRSSNEVAWLYLQSQSRASALVLLLGAWKNICSKQCAEKNQDLKLVHSVLDMLSEIEGRLGAAGAMCH
ncbi:hypothetical protein CPB85DRAFT_545882 [Mucidula mucida]|nr:hypothetical protein CPB85DRAFT_545882 [Mucidula mucida]